MATRLDPQTRTFRFSEHEPVAERGGGVQDVLVKITLPVSERTRALIALNDYNINHFTLFSTDDALIRTLAVQKLDLKLPRVRFVQSDADWKQ